MSHKKPVAHCFMKFYLKSEMMMEIKLKKNHILKREDLLSTKTAYYTYKLKYK